jgi:MutS-like protein
VAVSLAPVPTFENRAQAAQRHREERARTEAVAAALDRRMASVANVRVVAFLAAAAFLLLTVFHRLPLWGYLPAIAGAVAYGALAFFHGRLLQSEARARAEAAYHQRGEDRLTGAWHAHPIGGTPLEHLAEHPYAADLDVFGHGSLFQLLDEAATAHGEERLAAWLSAPALPDEVRHRQVQVRELAGRTQFRRDLAVEGRLGGNARVAPRAFIAWAESPPAMDGVRWMRPLAVVMPLLWVLTVVGASMDILPGEVPWLFLLIPAALLLVARPGIARSFEGLELGQRGADRLARALQRVEEEPFTSPELLALARGTEQTTSPSVAMRRLARLSSLAEQRRNQLHVVVNVLTLWDLHVFFRLDDWRRQHGRAVAGWLDRLADVEALACLGGYLHDRPDLVMPEVVEHGPRFVAGRLAHPLLDDAVPNDVSLDGPGQLLLVTGSNMSGKSTLLRAIGLNTVLALAGGPVSAKRLSLSGLHTWTSMRVQDSLEQGVSLFYAEVRRLKQVLEGAGAHQKSALVLVDEMLLGTNTRERRLASGEVLRLLLQTGCIGAVTTHDLSLAELARVPGSTLVPVHFQDVLEDGRMRFDYTLRPGVVQSTNALRVLALAGIPVRDDARE